MSCFSLIYTLNRVSRGIEDESASLAWTEVRSSGEEWAGTAAFIADRNSKKN